MTVILEDLQHILDAILKKGKIGTLSLGRKRRQRDIFFEPGNAYLLNRGNLHKTVLTEKIKNLPGFSENDLHGMVNELRETNETLPELLIRQNFIDQKTYEELLFVQVIEEMLDAIFTCRGSFLFHEDLVPEDLIDDSGYAANIAISHKSLINAIQAREKMLIKARQLIPAHDEVFIVSEKGLAESTKDQGFECRVIFSLIDGLRTVQKIISDAPFYEATVLHYLAIFLNKSLIKKTLLPELNDFNPKTMSAQQAQTALPRFEMAVRHTVNELKHRECLALVYERAKMTDKAVAEYMAIGDRMLQMKKPGKALSIYSRGLSLMPDNDDMRKKLYKLFKSEARHLASSGKHDTALNMLKKAREVQPESGEIYCLTAKMLLNLKDLKALRDLLDKATEAHRANGATEHIAMLIQYLEKQANTNQDLSLNKKIINTLIETEQTDAAIEKMTLMAERYKTQGENQKAKDLYAKIMKLAPHEDRARQQLRNLTGKKSIRPSKKILVKALAALILFGVLMYQAWTLVSFTKIAYAGSLESKMTRYAEFADHHPLSVCAIFARMHLKSTEKSLQSHRRSESMKLKDLFDKALGLEKIGDLPGATQLYKAIQQDGIGPFKQKAMTQLTALNKREQEAMNMLGRAMAQNNLGNFTDAFQTMKALADAYPHTQAATRIVFPLQVQSLPQGATIQVDGMAQGTTPKVLQIPRNETIELKLNHRGHQTYRTVLKTMADPVLHIILSKRPVLQVQLAGTIRNQPVLHGGKLFIASSDGTIQSLNPENGKETQTWTIPGATDITTGPILAGDNIVFATNDGRIGSLNPAGRLKILTTGGLIKSELKGLKDGAICYATAHKTIRRINGPAGKLQWEAQMPGTPTGRLLTTAESLIIPCRDNSFQVVALKSGRMLWKNENRHPPQMSCWVNLLLVADGRQASMKETNTGREYWKKTFPHPISQCLLSDGKAWLSLQNGDLVMLDAHTGEEKKKRIMDSGITQWQPHEKGLLICLANQTMFFLDHGKLQKKWCYRPKGQVESMFRNGNKLFLIIDQKRLDTLEVNTF